MFSLVDEQGEPIEVGDQLADTLVPLAKSQRENPTTFIENTEVSGDLASDPRFVEAYARATETLLRKDAS
jgi:mannitol 2-dehydrogenase